MEVWRYDLLSGRRDSLPLGAGICSDIRSPQFNNLVHVTLHADQAWRPRYALPTAFNELGPAPMVPADQPYAFHAITFVVWMDDGTFEPHERSNDSSCVFRCPVNHAHADGPALCSRSYQCVQLLQPPDDARSLSNLIVAAIRVLLPSPSSVLMDLLRNVGVFNCTQRGGWAISLAI